MTTLDDVLRALLDPAGPWQSHRSENGFHVRYRSVRLSHGLALAYQPAGVYGPADCLAISRRDGVPSWVEVRTVATALARVLGWPGLKLDIWDERINEPVKRLYWRPSPVRTQTPSNSLTLHQAVVYDRNEAYEEEWMSLGISTSRDEADKWLRQDQRLHMLRGHVVSYEVVRR